MFHLGDYDSNHVVHGCVNDGGCLGDRDCVNDCGPREHGRESDGYREYVLCTQLVQSRGYANGCDSPRGCANVCFERPVLF